MKKYYLILIFVCVVLFNFSCGTVKEKPDKIAEEYFKCGNAKLILKQYKEAIKDYDKAIELSPKTAVIHKNVNLKPEQYLKAVNDSNKAVKLARYYSSRGSAQYQLKQYQEAIKDYDKAIKLSHYKKKIYKNFKSKHNKVIELPMYYSARGSAKHKLKQYKEAINDYDNAIELNPKNVFAYYNRGLNKFHLNQYKESIKDFDRVIELNPKYVEAYIYRGVSKGKLKQYKEAIKDYDKVAGLNPEYVSIYDCRGYGNIKSKQYQEAIEAFDKVIGTNPKYVEAYVNRGIRKLDNHRRLEAIKDFNKAIELDSKCVKAYTNRGVAQLPFFQQKAIEDFNKAIELDPKNSIAYCYRGMTKILLEKFSKGHRYNATEFNYTKAMKDYNKAIEIDPENIHAYILRGNVYSSLKQYKEARIDLLKAKELAEKLKKAELIKNIEGQLRELDKKPNYFDLKPLTEYGGSGSCKCEKCKSLFAYFSNKYHEIYIRSPKAKKCIHKWEHVKKIDIYNLSLKWFDIKWNKHGLWYRILTNDNSELEKATKEKKDFKQHPDYWIPASSYQEQD